MKRIKWMKRYYNAVQITSYNQGTKSSELVHIILIQILMGKSSIKSTSSKISETSCKIEKTFINKTSYCIMYYNQI